MPGLEGCPDHLQNQPGEKIASDLNLKPRLWKLFWDHWSKHQLYKSLTNEIVVLPRVHSDRLSVWNVTTLVLQKKNDNGLLTT